MYRDGSLSWLITSAGRRSEVVAMGCGSAHVPGKLFIALVHDHLAFLRKVFCL
jgi:hypothetical protein